MTKIQRLSFPLSDDCVLGEPKELTLRGTPSSPMLIQHVMIKSECEGFFELEDIVIDGMRVEMYSMTEHDDSMLVEMGEPGMIVDPFELHRRARRMCIWVDGKWGYTTSKDSEVLVKMAYTGKVPTGFKTGHRFRAAALFMGEEVSDGH